MNGVKSYTAVVGSEGKMPPIKDGHKRHISLIEFDGDKTITSYYFDEKFDISGDGASK